MLLWRQQLQWTHVQLYIDAAMAMDTGLMADWSLILAPVRFSPAAMGGIAVLLCTSPAILQYWVASNSEVHCTAWGSLTPAIICCRSRSDPRFAFLPDTRSFGRNHSTPRTFWDNLQIGRWKLSSIHTPTIAKLPCHHYHVHQWRLGRPSRVIEAFVAN